MDYIVSTYICYLVISIPMTIWVARTLNKNGRIFLIDCFNGREDLADSVNRLLVVGFYLVNIGFVTLFLKTGTEIATLRAVFETLSTKVGTVLLVLGGMHFFNILVFHKMRKRALIQFSPPPVQPTATV